MSLNQFIKDLYLPYVEEQKRRSTYCGCKNFWLRYIESDGEVGWVRMASRSTTAPALMHAAYNLPLGLLAGA